MTYFILFSNLAPVVLKLSLVISKLDFPPINQAKDVVKGLLKSLVIAPDTGNWRCSRMSVVMVLLPQRRPLGRSVVTLESDLLLRRHIGAF